MGCRSLSVWSSIRLAPVLMQWRFRGRCALPASSIMRPQNPIENHDRCLHSKQAICLCKIHEKGDILNSVLYCKRLNRWITLWFFKFICCCWVFWFVCFLVPTRKQYFYRGQKLNRCNVLRFLQILVLRFLVVLTFHLHRLHDRGEGQKKGGGGH